MINHPLFAELVSRKLICPKVPFNPSEDSEGLTLALQLDATLMVSGFKLEPDLLAYLGGMDKESARFTCERLVEVAKKLIGDDVRHNVYFKNFPHQVPDTFEFWWKCIVAWFITGDSTYGRYQHSVEEMLALHPPLDRLQGDPLKVIRLGRSFPEEGMDLTKELIGSPVPLNEADRACAEMLMDSGYALPAQIPVRENRALVNAWRVRHNLPLAVDTVVDVLRLAAHLSGGDVTLVKPTRFKSFPRKWRRVMLEAIHNLLDRDKRKMDDATRYREQFKRLRGYLHPRDFPNLVLGAKLFEFCAGEFDTHVTFGAETQQSVEAGVKSGDFAPAMELMGVRPGVLMRHVDLIMRDGDEKSRVDLLRRVAAHGGRISGRVLLSVAEHLRARKHAAARRVFVNRQGRGWVKEEPLHALSEREVDPMLSVIWDEIARRVPESRFLLVDRESLAGVALPLSEKTKAAGHAVLPRGSVMRVPFETPDGHEKSALRFFMHWMEKEERTDLDLSCVFYTKDFLPHQQVSWTNLRWQSHHDNDTMVAVHSGDLTGAPAPRGASEFIDIRLQFLDPTVHYIIPTVNHYAGESFMDLTEAYFGFMVRPANGEGQPFEARTVRTKFRLAGDGGVALPLAFVRTEFGWDAKWLGLFCKGRSWGNRIEQNKFSTMVLARAILERDYQPVLHLVDAWSHRAKEVIDVSASRLANLGGRLPKMDYPVTYIGMSRPEGLHPDSQVFTLGELKNLIPA